MDIEITILYKIKKQSIITTTNILCEHSLINHISKAIVYLFPNSLVRQGGGYSSNYTISIKFWNLTLPRLPVISHLHPCSICINTKFIIPKRSIHPFTKCGYLLLNNSHEKCKQNPRIPLKRTDFGSAITWTGHSHMYLWQKLTHRFSIHTTNFSNLNVANQSWKEKIVLTTVQVKGKKCLWRSFTAKENIRNSLLWKITMINQGWGRCKAFWLLLGTCKSLGLFQKRTWRLSCANLFHMQEILA